MGINKKKRRKNSSVNKNVDIEFSARKGFLE